MLQRSRIDPLRMVVESHKINPGSIYSELFRREVIYALGEARILGPYRKDLPEELAEKIEYANLVIRPLWEKHVTQTATA